ncbi:MAG: metallophosphoesterase family protein [Desulfobacca sp.]|nr:metallophosphoesterase family protein [Desulfobacca sp.]
MRFWHRRSPILFYGLIIWCYLSGFSNWLIPPHALADSLPVKDPAVSGLKEKQNPVCNLFTVEQLYSAIRNGDEQGLRFDLSGINKGLDGAPIDPTKIYGSIYVGPYPFAAQHTDYEVKRFRVKTPITGGQGRLAVGKLFQEILNSEGWIDQGLVAVRLELYQETPQEDRKLGIYDTLVRFKKGAEGVVKLPTIMEGPLVNLVCSETPDRVVISFLTSDPGIAKVILDHGQVFVDPAPTTHHQITVTGLQPRTAYRYHVEFDNYRTKTYTFRTAPRPGKGPVTFAFLGDSREGMGGGAQNFMGVNYEALEGSLRSAFRGGAELVIFGGDLINGYSTCQDDFRTQLYAWKQTASGFWHERPIYPGIGNHESLLKVYEDGSKYGIELDSWPYDTDSVEAVFAAEFWNPLNGPVPADPRRPSYDENVYSFQYGPVKFISLNNCYWIAWKGGTWEAAKEFGGAPEGYLMADQFNWLKDELRKAEKDATIKYIVLFAHEPIFPNDGGLRNCMWHQGNNQVRAYTYQGGEQPTPDGPGIIDLRNELVRLLGQNPKVAVFLAGHEHGYSKLLIHHKIPVGIPGKDDHNGNDKLGDPGEPYSPLPDLKYPTWYITSGGAGAPYYCEHLAPWNQYWKRKPGQDFYNYSTQENFLIFTADDNQLSLKVFNTQGQLLDQIDNLMAVKKRKF